ncbi:MAG: hypothetical protein H6842_00230 [Rhodospirillaceae bacterium]|jgi:hypothetical protein|nr:hypothetical protein [Rhodospirillaceae bacterium]
MTVADLKRIVRLLGADGAIAGLRASEMTKDVFRDLAAKSNITVSQSMTRDELVRNLVEGLTRTEIKPLQDLMKMSYEDLVKYFSDAALPNSALLDIMKELNYKVSAEDRKHLRRFVARQISETALFSDVASRKTSDEVSEDLFRNHQSGDGEKR